MHKNVFRILDVVYVRIRYGQHLWRKQVEKSFLPFPVMLFCLFKMLFKILHVSVSAHKTENFPKGCPKDKKNCTFFFKSAIEYIHY